MLVVKVRKPSVAIGCKNKPNLIIETIFEFRGNHRNKKGKGEKEMEE